LIGLVVSDEIIRLRTNKAPPTERREAGTIPPARPINPSESEAVVKTADLVTVGSEPENILPPPPPPPAPTATPEENETKNERSKVESETTEKDASGDKVPEDAASDTSSNTAEESQNSEGSTASNADEAADASPSDNVTTKEDSSEEEREDGKSESSSESEKDYDSDEAVGKEEAAARDQDLDDDDDDTNDVQINPYDGEIQVVEGNNDENSKADPAAPTNKVTVMFQRLLNMNENQSGQMVIRVAGEGRLACYLFLKRLEDLPHTQLIYLLPLKKLKSSRRR